jgi:hypothetical protein
LEIAVAAQRSRDDGSVMCGDSGDPYEGGSFVGPLDTVFHIDAITAQ